MSSKVWQEQVGSLLPLPRQHSSAASSQKSSLLFSKLLLHLFFKRSHLQVGKHASSACSQCVPFSALSQVVIKWRHIQLGSSGLVMFKQQWRTASIQKSVLLFSVPVRHLSFKYSHLLGDLLLQRFLSAALIMHEEGYSVSH